MSELTGPQRWIPGLWPAFLVILPTLAACRPSSPPPVPPASPAAVDAAGTDPADSDQAFGTQPSREPATTVTAPRAPLATLPTPQPIGLRDLSGAAFIVWHEGDVDSGQLTVRDRSGEILARWTAPKDLGTRTRTRLAEAVSPDGRWLAVVQGDPMPLDLSALPANGATLRVLDLADGSLRFEQALLGPEVLTGLRADTLAEIERRHPGEARPPLSWEPSPTPPRPTASPEPTPYMWKGPWVAEEVTEGFNVGLGRLAWSPDGGRLAVIAAPTGPGSGLYLLDVDGWRWHRPLQDPGQPGALTWHPDGRRIFVVGSTWTSRASGYPGVEGAWLIDPDREALVGTWDVQNGVAVEELLQGWTEAGEAIVAYQNHGCGICAVLRLSPSEGIVAPFPDPKVPVNISDWFALKHLKAMPRGDWVAIAGQIPHLATTPETPSPGPLPTAPPPGTFLLDLVHHQLERVSDEDDVPLLYWGAPDLPFVLAADEPLAIGPGGRRQVLAVPGTSDWRASGTLEAKRRSLCPPVSDYWRASVSPSEARLRALFPPGSIWRTAVAPGAALRALFGPRGLFVFDARNRLVTQWTRGLVEDALWSPKGDQLLWVADSELWLQDLPGGTAHTLGLWRGTTWPGYPAGEALSKLAVWLGN